MIKTNERKSIDVNKKNCSIHWGRLNNCIQENLLRISSPFRRSLHFYLQSNSLCRPVYTAASKHSISWQTHLFSASHTPFTYTHGHCLQAMLPTPTSTTPLRIHVSALGLLSQFKTQGTSQIFWTEKTYFLLIASHAAPLIQRDSCPKKKAIFAGIWTILDILDKVCY